MFYLIILNKLYININTNLLRFATIRTINEYPKWLPMSIQI